MTCGIDIPRIRMRAGVSASRVTRLHHQTYIWQYPPSSSSSSSSRSLSSQWIIVMSRPIRLSSVLLWFVVGPCICIKSDFRWDFRLHLIRLYGTDMVHAHTHTHKQQMGGLICLSELANTMAPLCVVSAEGKPCLAAKPYSGYRSVCVSEGPV